MSDPYRSLLEEQKDRADRAEELARGLQFERRELAEAYKRELIAMSKLNEQLVETNEVLKKYGHLTVKMLTLLQTCVRELSDA